MSPCPSLRQALRAATRAEHEALEAQPLMRRLVSPELTLAEYSLIVRAQRAYYRLLEPALWPFERQLRDRLPDAGYRYQSRLPALERDSRQLALPADESEPGWVFRPTSAEQALGVLYVLEGASQGGRLIARRLEQVLALDGENGARFFSSYAEHSNWTLFCRWLEELPSEELWGEAITGAQKTFTTLHIHFDHWQRRV
ncbi:biliverdin-producing heme oxygenase [Marinimicrobium agarilyticum]|uniref:biliverdin-producing heme oxygenase n=1 Tax=Marinimicrobium agarilyticum TaxID=306546 RepID=UPI0012F657DF|nr:biliverdin-producing heme oxygenase [Marinimicrobium agarilyticum]